MSLFIFIYFYSANIKNRSLEIDLNFPLFKIKSQYEVKGKILMLPIEGKGAFVGNFSKFLVNYSKWYLDLRILTCNSVLNISV